MTEDRTAVRTTCDRLLLPYMLEGTSIMLLRSHFDDAESLSIDLGDPCPEGDCGPIVSIAHPGTWNPEDEDSRPTILVQRGPVSINQPTIASGNGMRSDGHPVYTSFWSGELRFRALARTYSVADRIANEAAAYMLQVSPALRRDFRLMRFHVKSLGAVMKRADTPDDYACDVRAQFHFEQSWSLVLQAPLVKKILLESSYSPSCPA